MKRFSVCVLILILLAACVPPPVPVTASPVPPVTATQTSTAVPPASTATLTSPPSPTVAPGSSVPNFAHIALILFENKEFGNVIGNPQMPTFNKLAREYTLLTQHYAVRHPSLPNYIALIGGDTFGIDSNCKDCFIDAPSLPDLIEASGRTWKTYQEDMPEPCFLGDKGDYVQKHNPFIYFDSIRLDAQRCIQSVVPLTQLQTDIQTNSLPNFLFIKPNLCNDGHDCKLDVVDAWLTNLLATLTPALDGTGAPYLIVMMFEEGQGDHGCCGLPNGGGRVAVVLDSPLVKNGFEDPTPYTHYSLLKTISEAWGLKYLGHAADDSNVLITAPWK
jgi:hypothetical protein